MIFQDTGNHKVSLQLEGAIYCRPTYGCWLHSRDDCGSREVRDPFFVSKINLTRMVISPTSTVQIVLSTAHPAKFSEAVMQAIQSPEFHFDRDVVPDEFRGLLRKKKRVIDVERPDVDLVKEVIEKTLAAAAVGEGGVSGATGGSV